MNNEKTQNIALELRACDPRQTQRATLRDKSATDTATTTQQNDLKSLALRVLERNRARNRAQLVEKASATTKANEIRKTVHTFNDPKGNRPTMFAGPDANSRKACGQIFCPECVYFIGNNRVCKKKFAPTPKTLWRRCKNYKSVPVMQRLKLGRKILTPVRRREH